MKKPSVQIPAESLEKIIASLKLDPIRLNHDDRVHGDYGVQLSFPLGLALEYSELPGEVLATSRSFDRMARFWVNLDDDGVLNAIAQTGSVYGNEPPLMDNYMLDLNQNGELSLRLYRIAANNKPLGVISPDQFDALSKRAGELLVQREIDHQKRQEKNMTPLQQQLNLLKVDGQRIMLPEQQLSEYPKIKSAMTKAGGRYGKAKLEGVVRFFFEFDPGVDVPATLANLQGGGKIDIKKDTQFFPTPVEEGRKALATLGDLDGKRVLEPSAGDGALADLAKQAGAEVVVIENWDINIKRLKAKGYDVIEQDFLSVSPSDVGPVDAVLMNPPFSGRQDVAHVKHALGFLAPDGELTAIMSPQFQSSNIKVSANFRELVQLSGADVEAIEAGAFKASGTNVSTVRVHIKMASLMAGLALNGKTAEDYGLSLPFCEPAKRSRRLAA